MIQIPRNQFYLTALFISLLALTGCSKGGGFNIFSLEDDRMLGAQVDAEILANPTEFPILSETQYADAYAYINGMKDDILNGGNVEFKDEFAWELRIIQDDNTLNAFATPGGYMYVYTGLIKYLDNASSLVGVIGHEIAHADRRHSTKAMTQQYGVLVLLEVALGNNQNLLSQIATELVFLKFSRDNETEADNQSVSYLCPTKYRADGAADFFQKIIDQGSANPPQFLSTHPNPDNRVSNIQDQELMAGCVATISSTEEDTEYIAFQNMLP